MCNPEARNYFSKPRMFKKISHYFLFVWVFVRISTNICIKRVQISLETGFYDAKYQTLRQVWKSGHPDIKADKNAFKML